MISLRSLLVAGSAALMLSSCVAVPSPAPAADLPPPMRWDFHPEAIAWSAASFAALDTHAAALPALVPGDIDAWCPAYADADEVQREAFWVGLISSLAEYESTWNPDAVGGGGRWFGLVQISPATARGYGCAATTGSALRDGPANLQCAMRIWAATVSRDGVVSEGRRGVAADWGPMSNGTRREQIREWVSQQSYCTG